MGQFGLGVDRQAGLCMGVGTWVLFGGWWPSCVEYGWWWWCMGVDSDVGWWLIFSYPQLTLTYQSYKIMRLLLTRFILIPHTQTLFQKFSPQNVKKFKKFGLTLN